MKIREINIVNFKEFQNITVVFNRNHTVIIGNNTSSKTTLLKAIQVGLGAYLQSLNKLPESSPYRRNFSSSDKFVTINQELQDCIISKDKTRITINADFPITESSNDNNHNVSFVPIHWFRELSGNKTTHTQACAGELIDIVHKMEKLRYDEKQKVVYPLVLSIGAHRSNYSHKSSFNINERASRIEKAYKYALHEKVDFKGAMEWLKHYDKDIKDKKEFEGTREAFFEALQKAIPVLSKVNYDNEEIEAIVTIPGHTPSHHNFSNMSDSIQSMINIVSEIAYRCIALNGCFGSNAIKMTSGVVTIDEIDSHLHPEWQKDVLHNLSNAFPMIQFIVSINSQYIIQNLKKEQIVTLS